MSNLLEISIKLFVWTFKVENAMLSEVFHQYLNSINIVIFSLLHCAILSVTDTIILFESWITMWTCPGNKLWLEVYEPDYGLNVLCHIFDEVKSFVITWTVPKGCINFIVFCLLCDKFCSKRCLTILKIVLKLLSGIFVNHHCWNSDACTCSIIWKDDVRDIFFHWIHDDCKSCTHLFHVSYLSHIGAVSTINHVNRGKDTIWITKEIICKMLVLLASCYRLIVVNSSNLICWWLIY